MAVSPEQILEYIRQHPGQKAKAIATALGYDASAVNRALYGPLFGKVHRDGQYQWFPAGASARSVMAKTEIPLTMLGRLCQYYLACLEVDVADGDSIFATSKFDDLQYAPLARLPLLPEAGPEVYEDYFNASKPSRPPSLQQSTSGPFHLGFTVSRAGADLNEPKLLTATQTNAWPFIASVTPVNVKVAVVAPE